MQTERGRRKRLVDVIKVNDNSQFQLWPRDFRDFQLMSTATFSKMVDVVVQSMKR
jgi:hypothetical protein